MATATAQRREVRRDPRRDVKEYTFLWEGNDRNNRNVRGEMKAASETVVTTNLRRQGIRITKLRRQSFRGGRRVNEKDITFFTRQLATMLKAGVPLLQAFEIVAPTIRRVATGTSAATARCCSRRREPAAAGNCRLPRRRTAATG